ncbi:putative porin [Aquimarina sp. D1M17]|uniref:putative porin n=1 Tax=Aquimarina acroporae TaxID=2937283 RepID=UPI0020BE7283|nr:putative porin [Aquimarina acroporae]MCK8522352.1 putative porin [Aquimarina acroporae]
MIRKFFVLVSVFCAFHSSAQLIEKDALRFSGDFRFRVEQDWDSNKSDGTKRDDRTRYRYRFRLQTVYNYKDWIQAGARIRTGNRNDQQGPHVTLGGNGGEFSLIELGLEKAYVQFYNKNWKAWLGKNVFPFYKQNELFWNDNVFPEGISVQYKHFFEDKTVSEIDVNLGHFVILSQNKSLDEDSYLVAGQVKANLFNDRLILYPGIFYFNDIADVPDGKGTFLQNYAILNVGAKFSISKKRNISLGIDLYSNFESLDNENIPVGFEDEKLGYVVGLQMGNMKKEKTWKLGLFYTYLEKYAIVDYFAQNDWARWDYSSFEATGSRLSNFKGVELCIGYQINRKLNLIFRGFRVEQIKKLGEELETGSRARLDLNFKF